MPETPWGPSVVPQSLGPFQTAPVEGAWDLQDSPLPLGAFAAPAAAWSVPDWLSVLGFGAAGEIVASSILAVLLCQYRQRGS